MISIECLFGVTIICGFISFIIWHNSVNIKSDETEIIEYVPKIYDNINIVGSLYYDNDIENSEIWDIFKSTEYIENDDKDWIKVYCLNIDKTVNIFGSKYWDSTDIDIHGRLYSEDNTKYINDNALKILYTMNSTANTKHNDELYSNIDILIKYTFSEKSYSSDVLKLYSSHNWNPLFEYMLLNNSNYIYNYTIDFENKRNDTMVAWFENDCNAYNGRQKYLKELFKYMTYHSYGNCLNNIKMDPSHFRRESEKEKYIKDIESSYKFIIIIENSNCIDYISDIISIIFKYNSIPIIYMENNIPNYNLILPKNSFINIADFKNVKQLSSHINKIGKNKELWNKYFWYKGNNKVYNDIIDNLYRYHKIKDYYDYPFLCNIGNIILNYNITNKRKSYKIVTNECLSKDSILKFI